MEYPFQYPCMLDSQVACSDYVRVSYSHCRACVMDPKAMTCECGVTRGENKGAVCTTCADFLCDKCAEEHNDNFPDHKMRYVSLVQNYVHPRDRWNDQQS